MNGSIARRPSGRWRARYRDRTGREHARHFEARSDARHWLDQVAARGSADPGVPTFWSFFEDWADRQIWSPTTASAMTLAARSTTFRDTPLLEVGRRDMEVWVKTMHDSGLAPGTVRTRYVNVRSVFRAAVREQQVESDPTHGIRLPRRRRRAASMAIPSPEQIGTLLNVSTPDFRAFIALSAFAGMRLGEVAGTQRQDIDFEAATLRVTRQVQRRVGGQIDVLPPKYRSERTIALAPGLLELLDQHLKLVEPVSCDGSDSWLFHRSGLPMHQHSVGYVWRKTLAAAGIADLRLHDLRHFYASGLIAAGCDVVTVQRALGHASATTTLDTYTHLWPGAADRTRNAVQDIIEETLSGTPTSAETLHLSATGRSA